MRLLKKLSLTQWIFLSMAAGVGIGVAAPDVGRNLQLLADIFLKLVKSIVAPLLFGTLVAGIAGTGSVKTMGRIAGKAILYFEILTTVALFIGLGAVNLVRPGIGVTPPTATKTEAKADAKGDAPKGEASGGPSLKATLDHTFPDSIIGAMASNQVLQIVVFCFMFGAACAAVGKAADPVVDFAHSLSEVMFVYTSYVMYFAPLGVLGAMAHTVADKGLNVLVNLGALVLTVYGALVVFILCVLVPTAKLTGVPVRRFFSAVREPFVLAFSTASSESALPLALRNMERFGVPKHIVAFVLPTGYSFNLDGSTLYLSLAAVFVAQASGVHLSFTQQVLMLLTLMLTSKGVAGVRGASYVVLTSTVAAFGIPVEAAAIILGVDVLCDMARTSVNVVGNCLATAVVGRWEGVRYDEEPAAALSAAAGSQEDV